MKYEKKYGLCWSDVYRYVFDVRNVKLALSIRRIKTIYFFAFLFFSVPFSARSQFHEANKLKAKINLLKKNKDYLRDTAYLNSVISLGLFYADRYPDSALTLLATVPAECAAANFELGQVNSLNATGNAWLTKGNLDAALKYYNGAYGIADKNKIDEALPGILGNIAVIYLNKGNYSVALEKFYASMHLAEKRGNKPLIRNSLNNIATIQFYQGKMNEAEAAYVKTLIISKELADTPNIILCYNNIGEVNVEKGKINKAIGNLLTAYKLAHNKNMPNMVAAVSNTLGDCYFRLDSLKAAESYFTTALQLGEKTNHARAIAKAEIGLAKVKTKHGLYKVALGYGLNAIKRAEAMGQAQLQRDALEVVAEIYEKMGNGNLAIVYYKQYKKYSDSLINVENERVSANLKADYQIAKKEEIFQRKTTEQRWWIFSVLAALASTILIILVIIRNKKKLNQTYRQLQEKTGIIEEQKIVAEKTLDELKATQKQLIQNEKMASLGELTAGIAHEIQNPLNFVNNFSELSNELIDEMVDELDKGNAAEVKAIAEDIKQNLEKINNHGKRADAIVRGMLQHSRTSTGKKELTDINALCDEYLRLSYHGLRAKDKSFNAELKTDFDASLEKINIIPQDIGRIVLNLLTNAFYAVDEKQKAESLKQNAEGDVFEPKVSIITKKEGNQVLISVTDNGNGIPASVKEKIFQPFFTTKPTGQGTGLGLSLSYDIVKVHGGELKVETKEGEGSTFIIQLPMT